MGGKVASMKANHNMLPFLLLVDILDLKVAAL
jgi:hypothetical protein